MVGKEGGSVGVLVGFWGWWWWGVRWLGCISLDMLQFFSGFPRHDKSEVNTIESTSLQAPKES